MLANDLMTRISSGCFSSSGSRLKNTDSYFPRCHHPPSKVPEASANGPSVSSWPCKEAVGLACSMDTSHLKYRGALFDGTTCFVALKERKGTPTGTQNKNPKEINQNMGRGARMFPSQKEKTQGKPNRTDPA